MSRSLNKVSLLGNLTRDVELRYTENGQPVCSFGLATNRKWTTDAGEPKEESEFHRITAWGKLAEICATMLAKGSRAFVQGRLHTTKWTSSLGEERQGVEIVLDDMINLSYKEDTGEKIASEVHDAIEKDPLWMEKKGGEVA